MLIKLITFQSLFLHQRWRDKQARVFVSHKFYSGQYNICDYDHNLPKLPCPFSVRRLLALPASIRKTRMKRTFNGQTLQKLHIKPALSKILQPYCTQAYSLRKTVTVEYICIDGTQRKRGTKEHDQSIGQKVKDRRGLQSDTW